jgi:hypothetical protein
MADAKDKRLFHHEGHKGHEGQMIDEGSRLSKIAFSGGKVQVAFRSEARNARYRRRWAAAFARASAQ